MKHTRSQPTQSSFSALLAQHFSLDPRWLTVLSVLILAMIQARSVVLYQLLQIVDLPASDDTVYPRLKRFMQFQLPDLLIARFVLAHLRDEQQLLLVLERTNWKLGQQDINILLLSVRWQTFSFPLSWTLLPHSGNSNMATCIALVEHLLPLLQGKRLFLTADREFIGSEWFVALRRMNISPVIRLRADRVVEGSPVWVRFKKLRPGELRVWREFRGSGMPEPLRSDPLPGLSRACRDSFETLRTALDRRKHAPSAEIQGLLSRKHPPHRPRSGFNPAGRSRAGFRVVLLDGRVRAAA